MRITNNMMVTNTIRNVNAAANRLNEATERIASEMKIDLPSDDPVVATQTIKYRDYLAKIEQYKSNASAAASWQKTTDSSLTGLAEIIGDIQKKTNQAANGTVNDSNLADIKAEIESNLEEIIQLMNADYGGRHIFGGYSTDEEPYALTGKSIAGKVSAASGSYTDRHIGISDDLPAGTYSVNVAYSDGTYTITMNCGDNIYTGTTTSIGGTVSLTDASGKVGAALTAPSGGFSNGDAFTVPVSITKMVTFKGKCLGTVCDGNYSDDAIAALYSGNTYTDSGVDESINYNIGYDAEVGVNTEGQDVIGDGTANLFNTLSKLIMALNGETTYKSYDAKTGKVTSGTLNFSSLLTDLSTDLNRVTTAQATLGARMNYVNRVSERLNNNKSNYTELLSDTIDVDTSEASIEQSNANVVYQAALSVGAKAISKSLVDYMV
ncbi:hypothetical protein P22_1427 [Propionispora sp. 2/2-37]|uniref:flagellar hook-associated protein FlgL n=1 Tax=Propionispora sp. 2/2-37 TaxID=1677858 RepID=UPI0006BB5B8E|nr:flagellar hook-associated protein FlgL [Propionispora sp. 2/2-37]CUH95357.1 hypothetical protein P22_1427 [Propionispora sp. 2/2-37]